MMATRTGLLMLSTLLGLTFAQNFCGTSVTFLPLHRTDTGELKLMYYHRLNGKSECAKPSSYTCEDGVCTSFMQTGAQEVDNSTTDGGPQWCQSEEQSTLTLSAANKKLTLSDSGCCWVSNVEDKTNWESHAEMDLGIRSDTNDINNCPVTATVSNLRVPQNCFTKIHLLAHDPDGDKVRCSFAADATVPSNIGLDGDTCTLMAEGEVAVGVHALDLVLQDFNTEAVNVTYGHNMTESRPGLSSSLCNVTLQVALEVVSSLPDCDAGHVVPMFLADLPSDGNVFHATVGQPMHVRAQAVAHHASIHDFQVSGPLNMTKEVADKEHGVAELTLSWTPQPGDLNRAVPVCFTAETSESQSPMKCVVVAVSHAEGTPTVQCTANKMTVAVEKSTILGVSENFLRLNDPSCTLTSNETHIVGTMSFSDCGTTAEDGGGYIAFKNEIQSFDPDSDVISRKRVVKIEFACRFPKTISISSSYSIQDSDFVFNDDTMGSIGYSFNIYTDENFDTAVDPSAFPVEVQLMDKVYLGIKAESSLENVEVFVESCRATPDDNPNNTVNYDMIKNGCYEDETIKRHTSDDMSYNFEIQAFKFTGSFDQIYFTCSVFVCEVDNPFSRCAQGCVSTEAFRRRKRELGKETSGHQITQGPLQFVSEAIPHAAIENKYAAVMHNYSDVMLYAEMDMYSERIDMPEPVFTDTKSSGGVWQTDERFGTNVSTVFFASVFLLSLVALAVFAAVFTRNRRADDQKPLLVSKTFY